MARNATKTPPTKLSLVEASDETNSDSPPPRSAFARQMTEFADDLDLFIEIIENS